MTDITDTAIRVVPSPVDKEDGLLAREMADRVAKDLAQAVRENDDFEFTEAETAELADSFTGDLLEDYAASEISRGRPAPGEQALAALRSAVLARVLGLGGLQALMDDPDIETINANGCDEVFAIRADGTTLRQAPIAPTDEAMVELIRRLAVSGGEERRFDRGVARLNAELPDGSRLFAAVGVCRRPCLSIRRNRLKNVSLDELVGKGMLDRSLAAFLTAIVGAGFNILISGGQAAGKTTVLRAVMNTLDPNLRLVLIEDTYELRLDQMPERHHDVVSFQAREANTEGAGAISQAELVRWALRMSPDRVIVGELRNDEFIPMCNAMNQGLDGSAATVHASSSAQVVERMINLGLQSEEHLPAEATVRLLGSAVDFIIQLDRKRDPARTRVITSVREVCGSDGLQLITNEVWRPGPDRRAIPGVQLRPQTLERLSDTGYDPATWEED
jgi:Flp pilus assembly CpaF family ATPase